MQLADNFFIYPDANGMVLWNYGTHEQFYIDDETISLITRLANGKKEFDPNDPHMSELSEVTLIVRDKEDNWCWDVLSRIFHMGTKDIPISEQVNQSPESWVREYLHYCEQIGDPPQRREVKELAKVPLPAPDTQALDDVSLNQVLTSRKTSRVFRSCELPVGELGNILYATFGLFHDDWSTEFEANGLQTTAVRKTSPSGGGLHPVEAYVIPFSVSGLHKGVYRYNPQDHSLSQIRQDDLAPDLVDLLWGQYYAKDIAFGVFLSARLDLAAWKYKHSRAYRNVLLDVGHLSQTFQLVATAQGLGTWLTGAFHDSRVEQIIDIDGSREAVLFFLGAGDGTGEAFDETMRQAIGTLP